MEKQPLSQFYNENVKLIHFATNKAHTRLIRAGFGDSVEREEIFSMLTECFIKAYNAHDNEKSKFSTYFVMSAHNRITNYLIDLNKAVKTVSTSSFTDDSEEECFDDLFGIANDGIEAMELSEEIKYIKDGLSPFARTLLEYTINPPEFIEKEYLAQQAQSDFALSIGTRAYHYRHFGLGFVARCLKDTVETVSAERFIRDAVNEIKEAVETAVSNR